MNKDGNMIFQEVQKFRQWWLWLILLPSCMLLVGLFGYGMIEQLVFGQPWGDDPMSDTVLLIVGGFFIALGAGLIWLFYTAKLITEVRSDGLYIRLFPLHFSFLRIPLENLKRYEVRTYSPIKECRGWGIRSYRSGKAYNVSGNRGVALEFLDGRPILIGSQRPEELAKAIAFVLRSATMGKAPLYTQ
ncbi:DUF6141 family protein [Dehalococcoidia bacterium]|nr:DUF6141 family protein [Dehalococcoidia bacterium]MCL0073355.1 DUF6141 family protein [Dehalococcoidia bacterium]